MKFIKMHGCGNDYIYFNCFEEEINLTKKMIIDFSDRRKGIGGDGVVLIKRSQIADARMRMFNNDASEGKMCGNAIRCIAKYLYEEKIVDKKEISIETLSGVKKCFIKPNNEVMVDMGSPIIEAKMIPVDSEKKNIINEELVINNETYKITCVSMGNPHCVIFTRNIDDIDLEKIGPLFEKNKLFPEGINTEFIEVIDKNVFKMRVWERGSGETFACGTGACASVVAAVMNRICDENQDVKVILKGGTLIINASYDKVYMTGPAVKVYEGSIDYEN